MGEVAVDPGMQPQQLPFELRPGAGPEAVVILIALAFALIAASVR
jgi:hypothetical protein